MAKSTQSTANRYRTLLKKSSTKWFITQDDILDVFVEPELYIEILDDLYDTAIREQIDIFESVADSGDTGKIQMR